MTAISANAKSPVAVLLTDPTTGLPYKAGPASPSGSIQFNSSGVFGGSSELTWDTANHALTISATTPTLNIYDTDATADHGKWRVSTTSSGLSWSAVSDDLTSVIPFFTFNRGNVSSKWVSSYLIDLYDTDSQATSHAVISFSDQGMSCINSLLPAMLVFGIEHTGSSTIAGAEMFVANSNQGVILIQPGDSFSGPVLTDGPSGNKQGVITTADDSPLVIGTNFNAVAMFDQVGNFVPRISATATSDTDGFTYGRFVSGNQTGVPAHLTGLYANSVPFTFQNNSGVYSLKAYINGGWRSVALV